MTEYVTREEVLDILDGAQRTAEITSDYHGALQDAVQRVQKLYAYRPDRTSIWKPTASNSNAIYCEKCEFTTLAYKATKYCPSCGRHMENGK